jgi:hypothetical protein
MSKYLKLVNFEINRFIKLYAALLVITVISQFIGVLVQSKGYMKSAQETMAAQSLTKTAYIEQFGKLDFLNITNSLWFLVPIAICAVALIFYIFLVWYRDWFGKNTFIYRLLMLPTARLHVYLAKATAIFLMVFGLVAIQLIILPLEIALYESIVAEGFKVARTTFDIIHQNPLLNVLVPNTLVQFFLHYAIGFMAVFIIFTAIMFERSYRIRGILMGIVYHVVAWAVFLAPLFMTGFLYPKELLGVEIVIGLLVSGVSIWIGNLLLNKKVTV